MADQRGKTSRERIAEQAAGWVARLQSGDATEADRQRFKDWLEADPAHAEAFEEFRDLWGELKDVPIPPDRLKKLKGARRRALAYRSGALALAILVSTSLLQGGFVDRLRADYYTSIGEVRSVMLADGTRVDLNSDTAITVDYSDSMRRVRVLRGEAFFGVAKNPQRPFVVAADGLTATAVGTHYAVRAGSASFDDDVQVEEGRVEVRSGSESVLVEAGYAADMTAPGRVVVRSANVEDATAWRAGKLIFSQRPLREVLLVLARYRHGRIVVVDEAAAEQKVSGIFDLTDTDGALREIESGLPVSVTHLTGLMVVVRSRTP